MNTQEAKFILQARRPDGSDDGEPRFAEALEQARRDPALAEWLAREQAFDTAMADKLRAMQPPAELRAAILAGARMGRTRPFWMKPQVLALAACGVILLGLVALWPVSRAAAGSTDQLALGVMGEVTSDAHREAMPQASGALRTWLTDSGTRLTAGVPGEFAQLKTQGCRSLTIGGREVLEVCFQRGGTFHLYVARREDFSGEAEPMFRERGGVASVAWADRRNAYVLVTDDGTEALRRLL